MSMNTLLYGLIVFFALDRVLLRTSAMSQLRDDGTPLHPFSSGGHEYVEPFEYAVKRETDSRDQHPGAAYIRVGRSHVEGTVDQDYGYNNEVSENSLVGSRPSSRVRSESFIRFGRSSLKVPHHKIEQTRGFERIGKSGGSKYVRVGRNVPSASTSDAEMQAILSPSILVERNAHCNKDLQQCYDRLAYICGDNNNNNINNNNNNGINGEVSDDRLHRNNFQYFDASEGLA